MLTRTKWFLIAGALLMWGVAPVDAMSIVLRPSVVLSGVPGATVGWGYEIRGDPEFDLVFTTINADILAGDGSISPFVFDYPTVAAGTNAFLEYDPPAGLGLVELTLSPLLLPGALVTGRVYGDFERRDALGNLFDAGSWELEVSATAVPEPGTLLLMGTGALLLARRRFSKKTPG